MQESRKKILSFHWEKKKKQPKTVTRRFWDHSLLLQKPAAELHYGFLQELIPEKPFLGRKKLEQISEGRQALNQGMSQEQK